VGKGFTADNCDRLQDVDHSIAAGLPEMEGTNGAEVKSVPGIVRTRFYLDNVLNARLISSRQTIAIRCNSVVTAPFRPWRYPATLRQGARILPIREPIHKHMIGKRLIIFRELRNSSALSHSRHLS
jgi:hypothetical protein